MDRRGDRGRPDLIRRLTTAAAGAVLSFATWPFADVRPRAGVDGSWVAGLHLAADRGLDHGSEIVFTHGPLGFLGQPRSPVLWTAVLAVLFTWLVRFALCVTLVGLLRRRFPLPLALLLAFLVARWLRSETAEVLVTLCLVWSLLAVRGLLRFPPALAGAVAAAAMLLKFNAGIAVLFFAVVTAVAVRQRVVRVLGAFAGTFAAAWVVTGNSLGDVPRWLRGSYELAAGYTSAMAGELPGLGWHYAVAPLLVAGLLALGVTVPERRARWATGLLLLGGLALAVKHGFVRHDGHAAAFFLPCALVPLALFRRIRLDFVTTCVTVLCAALVGSLLGPKGAGMSRSDVRDTLRVDPVVLAAIGDRTVHVDPWEISAVWAYGLRWLPAPVLQSYSAYTPWLDDLHAEGLTADVVLRPLRPPAVDGRVPAFESPAYVLALVCSYRAEVAGERWRLLARVPWRCGEAVRVRSVRARAGESVVVPEPSSPDRLVYARLHLSVPVPVRVRDLLLKSPPDRIVLDGRSYRFVRGTAAQPHVLRVPDQERVLPGGPLERSVSVLRLPGFDARVDFYELPFVSVTPPS